MGHEIKPSAAQVVEDIRLEYGAANNDLIKLMHKSRAGLPFSVYERLVESGPCTATDWARILHLSERTLQRYKKSQRRFDAQQSERILQCVMLFSHALEVIRKGRVSDWLHGEVFVLENKAPIDFLDNSFGIKRIESHLTSIEYDLYS
jgi:putative toxin-antitoxin system antitoxin component (TIGR02293 family)